jgi:energy-coupling factor transport system ATP-binding protein
MSVRGGEVIGIVGRNGSGKTTFLRAICGLHKKMEGQIFLNGLPRNRNLLMKQSYLVMQDVNYELFAESVEKECVFGIKEPDMTLAYSILDELELTPFRQWHPNILSGGQKQRLAIAVSMICGKEVLVFDEPTSGLDFDNMIRVASLIKRLAQIGKIVFLATHDYEFVCQTCNRVLRIDEIKKKEDWDISQKNEVYLRQLFGIEDNFKKTICDNYTHSGAVYKLPTLIHSALQKKGSTIISVALS